MATKQIVIIGASFAGLPIAHGLLKDVLPSVSSSTKQSYKVILISTSDKFWFKVGAPRAVANPDLLPVEKALLPFVEKFKSYNASQFEFILAAVESIDTSTTTLRLNNGKSVEYDSLVIASGTNFPNKLWTVSDGTEPLLAALKDIHTRLPKASSILLAGGGPVGVETAGELGNLYGHKKEITLLSGTTRLLGRVKNPRTGADAAEKLSKMGVKVIHNNVRVTSSKQANDGKTILQLSDGTTKTVDVYIDATGDRPNTSFVPPAWLDGRKFVKTDAHTLRLDVPGVRNVYAVGSVASFSNGSIMDASYTTKAILESIKLDLLGNEPGPRNKNIYKKVTSDIAIVPVGPHDGVGVLMGWRLPGFAVRMIKSKDFMIGKAAEVVQG